MEKKVCRDRLVPVSAADCTSAGVAWQSTVSVSVGWTGARCRGGAIVPQCPLAMPPALSEPVAAIAGKQSFPVAVVTPAAAQALRAARLRGPQARQQAAAHRFGGCVLCAVAGARSNPLSALPVLLWVAAEGDRRAYYETSQWTMKQNQETVTNLKRENRELKKALSTANSKRDAGVVRCPSVPTHASPPLPAPLRPYPAVNLLSSLSREPWPLPAVDPYGEGDPAAGEAGA